MFAVRTDFSRNVFSNYVFADIVYGKTICHMYVTSNSATVLTHLDLLGFLHRENTIVAANMTSC